MIRVDGKISQSLGDGRSSIFYSCCADWVGVVHAHSANSLMFFPCAKQSCPTKGALRSPQLRNEDNTDHFNRARLRILPRGRSAPRIVQADHEAHRVSARAFITQVSSIEQYRLDELLNHAGKCAPLVSSSFELKLVPQKILIP